MSGEDFDDSELAKWDPGFVQLARKVVAPIANSGSGQMCGVWNACRPPVAHWW
jgi:hypothetical protein